MGSYSLRQLIEVARSLGAQPALGRLAYPLRQRFYEARYPPGSAEPRSFAGAVVTMLRQREAPIQDRTLGSVESYLVDGRAVDLTCGNGVLRLEVMADDLIHLHLFQGARSGGYPQRPSLPFSYALDPETEWPPFPFEVQEVGTPVEAVLIRTERITCRVEKAPCRVIFLDAQGQPLSEASDGLGFRSKGAYWTRRLVEGEAIYGLAEKTFDLNLRGQTVEMWNTDPEGYQPGVDPINLCIPMLVGLREGRAYGLFFDNPGRARFDLGQKQHDRLRYTADTGELCAYFFGGGTISAVLERYTQLTGRMPLQPRWMLGYHQSRWSYHPEE
ncbi:MAG TPA: hypothetical protein VLY63_23905, partial [Anaerolineae bacterium]|nr:hypothetical protein [Anaerolineae bacterium]